MALTAIQQRIGNITVPPTPKPGSSLSEVQQNTFTWTKQAQQTLVKISKILGTLDTSQIPQGGTIIVGNHPQPPGVYFTPELARAAVSATAPILYDQTTGIFSMHVADAMDDGYLSASDWALFDAKVPAARTLNTTAPLTGGGDLSADLTLAITLATTSTDGYLSSTDWNTFNGKVSATRLINTTAPLSGGGDLSADRTLIISLADTVTDGYLSSTDWNTFNGKVPAARLINTTAPLTGGGDLSADRTLSIPQADATHDGYLSAADWVTFSAGGGGCSCGDAFADGSTKGLATFVAADFSDDGAGLISLDYTNGQKASASVPGFLSSTDWSTFNSKIGTARQILTTSPLSGGGDLSADRTIVIADAAADGTTKGAATFLAADFNSSSGLISLDYTNAQKATGSVPGFLTAADWTTFNAKVGAARQILTTSPLAGGGDLSADRTLTIANAKADASTKGAATFTTNDFDDDGSGKISLDYTNGQKASASVPGFLSSTDWSTFNTAAAGNLVLITSPTTYFVRTDGNDSNAGTANTSGGAWLTVQRAINFVLQRLIIQKGVTVTIQIGDGTYTESPTCSAFAGGGVVTIQGNTTTPANVVIATGTGGFNILSNGWTLNAFKITGTGNGVDVRSGALVTISNINLGTTGTSQLQAIYGGTIFIATALTFSASATFALFATRGGTIQSVSSPTITISGTPAYTIYAFADINGVIYMPATTFSGSATGQRYSALLTGAIFTNAGGANYFPGNSAGSTATGGQYA